MKRFQTLLTLLNLVLIGTLVPLKQGEGVHRHRGHQVSALVGPDRSFTATSYIACYTILSLEAYNDVTSLFYLIFNLIYFFFMWQESFIRPHTSVLLRRHRQHGRVVLAR